MRIVHGILGFLGCLLLLATGCGNEETCCAPSVDASPPAPVHTLTIRSVTDTSVTLSWTASGDDGQAGQAAAYDLRYAEGDSSCFSWAAALRVAPPPAPGPAGTAESYTVTGLAGNRRHTFGLKVGDEVQNWSDLSGLVSTPSLWELTPATLKFGAVRIDSTAVLTVALHNRSGRMLPSRVVVNCGTFTVSVDSGTVEISSGQVMELPVLFSPRLAGPDSCWIRIGDENCGGVFCTGTGVGPPVSAELVLVPEGRVRIGLPGPDGSEPVHDLDLPAFRIDRYEVTTGQYKAFMDAGGYTTESYWNPVGWQWIALNGITQPEGWRGSGNYRHNNPDLYPDFPVQGVSWWEADAYARWAGGRLPTEAEWEKAAKGGCGSWGDPEACDSLDTPIYGWGSELKKARGNYLYSDDPYEDRGGTTPAGFFDGGSHAGFRTLNTPSPYGLYDTVGNVSEWCSSRLAAYPYDPDDGRELPPVDSAEWGRVIRGGSWTGGKADLRCAARKGAYPNARGFAIGFRCAEDAD